jgi:hypothetical protein
MLKIAANLLPVAALLCLPGLPGIAQGDDKPEPGSLAHFRFNGDAKDANPGNPDFQLRNTTFKDNALYLNGIHFLDRSKEGYRALCRTPGLDYKTFTVTLRFKADEFGPQKSTLLMGGTSYRWYGLQRSADGNLTIILNNHRRHEIKDAAIEPGKWNVVACGVDVPNRKLVVYLNAKRVAGMNLSKSFQFDVTQTEAKERDKVWTFTNFGSASVFHGLVDELIIYGKMLSAEEFAKIPLRP